MSLKDKLIKTIQQSGPITMAHYMAECLGNKTHGYYMVENPFPSEEGGSEGDFITAPEVSQMFGEVIGLMLLDHWMNGDQSDPINLVELGPGQGTLMADVLRVLSIEPALKEKLTIHFVEMSPRLRALQEEKVPNNEWGTTWHDTLNDLPAGTTWFLANEFFDALPVHQFQKTEAGWVERAIGVDENDNLCLVTLPAGPQVALMDKSLAKTAKLGDVIEVCPAAISIMGDITNHLKTNIGNGGGLAAIIDYGYGTHAVGDSLQALKNHKFKDILDQPGKQDLTTHVNFAALEQVAKEASLKTLGPVYQGDYLLALGIEARAEALKKSGEKFGGNHGDKTDQEKIQKALNRLTGADEMGELFKVMVVVNETSQIPAPFSIEG